jgi:uridine phosphorylase
MLVRVGTSGSMQPDVAPGDFVVATAAVRDEGTSRAYPHRIPRRRRS